MIGICFSFFQSKMAAEPNSISNLSPDLLKLKSMIDSLNPKEVNDLMEILGLSDDQIQVEDISTIKDVVGCPNCKDLEKFPDDRKSCYKVNHCFIGRIKIHNFSAEFTLMIDSGNIQDIMMLQYTNNTIFQKDNSTPSAFFEKNHIYFDDIPVSIFSLKEEDMREVQLKIVKIVNSWNIKFMNIEPEPRKINGVSFHHH